MADFGIKKRDAKTGNKKERVIPKVSLHQVQNGQWTRGVAGPAYHFFVDGASLCGRMRSGTGLKDTAVRKLCPECFAAVSRTVSQAATFGEV